MTSETVKLKTVKKYVIFGIVVLTLVVCGYVALYREKVLVTMGEFLVVDGQPEHVDAIIPLRGDSNYRRILSAAQYFKDGYSDYIYIPMALSDRSTAWLEKHSVRLPSEQERERAILVQLGIPDKKILIGSETAGGGTQGELMRIKKMAFEHGFKKTMVVTNWWHTRRTKIICQDLFEGTEIKALVVSAGHDMSNPTNWWKYRYEAVNVIEEYGKLVLLYLEGFIELRFADDPAFQEE